MNNRRDFLKSALLTAGGLSATGTIPGLFANTGNGAPKRFIFMHRGNGLFPSVMPPPTLSEQDKAKEKKKEPFEADLDQHDLPGWMEPLHAHK